MFQINRFGRSLKFMYLCDMKRFLIYSLMAVTLFLGVARFTMPDESAVSTILTGAHQPSTDDNQFHFQAADFYYTGGAGVELFRLQNLFQQSSLRLFSFSSNVLRVANSIQLSHRQYLVSTTSFLLKSAFKQLDGYYLYYLRKILI